MEIKKSSHPHHFNRNRILWVEAMGFTAIIIISWLDEAIGLPYRLAGIWSFPGGWQEAFLETLIVLAVAIPTLSMTSRLLHHLHSLEAFLRVCAWCRKLDLDGKWVPMEEYFENRSEVKFTHGICEECARKVSRGEI